MNFTDSQAVRELKAHWEEVPQHKRRRKWAKAVGGVVWAGLLSWILHRVGIGPVPWWAYAAGYAMAGYLISPDVMKSLKVFVVGLIRDVRTALKNGNG